MSAKRFRILLLNGPNLNLLGRREPGVYGVATLADIERDCQSLAAERNVDLDFFQSNHEGALVDRIGAALGTADFIIINPAAFTHTSIAIRDALLAVGLPIIEIHLSNIYRRETFRHHSYISDIAVGQISGLGALGYRLAIEAAVHRLHHSAP
ncbi:MAG: 3-dehydroquinate dehydratase, type II [Magnetococcales bacterium]|nr:3-dehydroquinate dehydratase, type II [Magnetococcales bacterium]